MAVTVILVASCAAEQPPAPDQVTGMITEVRRAQGRIIGFTLNAGTEDLHIDIDPDRDYGFDLEHLEDHRRSGDPVRVNLRSRGGRLVALTILDA
jgi:hypothetical protein